VGPLVETEPVGACGVGGSGKSTLKFIHALVALYPPPLPAFNAHL